MLLARQLSRRMCSSGGRAAAAGGEGGGDVVGQAAEQADVQLRGQSGGCRKCGRRGTLIRLSPGCHASRAAACTAHSSSSMTAKPGGSAGPCGLPGCWGCGRLSCGWRAGAACWLAATARAAGAACWLAATARAAGAACWRPLPWAASRYLARTSGHAGLKASLPAPAPPPPPLLQPPASAQLLPVRPAPPPCLLPPQAPLPCSSTRSHR